MDDKIFGIIEDAYSKIDFFGQFEKGNTEAYDFYKEQYLKLLKCEVTFFDKRTQKKYYINEFNEMDFTKPGIHSTYNGGKDTYDANNYIYYFFDIDSDGNPELCISDEARFVYIMKHEADSDSFILWHEIPPSWTHLLGSRKLSFGGGTSPAQYAYCSLDQYGKEEYMVWFYVAGYYDAEKKQDDTIYAVALPEFTDKSKSNEIPEKMENQAFFDVIQSDRYYFRVTEEQYYELTKDFFKARELSGGKIKEVRFTYSELFK